jgi:hypothetical protein
MGSCRSWKSWPGRGKGKIRADVAHEKITAMGYVGPGADHPAGGGPAESGLSGRSAAGAPAVDPRARDLGAV